MEATERLIAACGIDCTACPLRTADTDPQSAQQLVGWFRSEGWLEEDEGTSQLMARGPYCTGCRGDRGVHIKLNGTDYLPGGTDMDNVPELAREIEKAGVDAIEISGGMWECLVRSEEELGFRPVPSAESQTRLRDPTRQSYFLPYAERLSLSIPIILVGGNRDVERLEAILRQGSVDLIALCRPLISEPDLPQRWRQGRGSSGTDCISCNSCLYDMYTRLERGEPGIATCLVKQDLSRVEEAGRWLRTWVKENAIQ
jgi:hypothetical protein